MTAVRRTLAPTLIDSPSLFYIQLPRRELKTVGQGGWDIRLRGIDFHVVMVKLRGPGHLRHLEARLCCSGTIVVQPNCSTTVAGNCWHARGRLAVHSWSETGSWGTQAKRLG